MKTTIAWGLAIVAIVVVAVIGVSAFLPGTQNASATSADTVIFWHDDSRAVGCWIYGNGYKGGISCLPDGQYRVAP